MEKGDYVIISTELFNLKLSLEAVGLLTYFLSKPDGTEIKKTTLHKDLGIGRERTDRIFKELQRSGFIKTEKSRDKDGKITYRHKILDKLIIT